MSGEGAGTVFIAPGLVIITIYGRKCYRIRLCVDIRGSHLEARHLLHRLLHLAVAQPPAPVHVPRLKESPGLVIITIYGRKCYN